MQLASTEPILLPTDETRLAGLVNDSEPARILDRTIQQMNPEMPRSQRHLCVAAHLANLWNEGYVVIRSATAGGPTVRAVTAAFIIGFISSLPFLLLILLL